MKFHAFAAVMFLTCCSGMAKPSDLFDFVPRNSCQVLKLDLVAIEKMEIWQNDTFKNFSRQANFDGEKYNPRQISGMATEILIVNPVLMKDTTFIFVRTELTKEAFLSKLEQITGVRHISVKTRNRTEYRITLPPIQFPPGDTPASRTFSFAFLSPHSIVFAKDSLDDFWTFKPLGLPLEKRKYFQAKNFLAGGFLETDPAFLQEKSFLPPFQRLIYFFAADPPGALRFQAEAACVDKAAANQVLMMFQQYVMIGGLFFNQAAPELMQEWTQGINILQNDTVVRMKADFSKGFLTRLLSAAEKPVQRPGQPEKKQDDSKR